MQLRQIEFQSPQRQKTQIQLVEKGQRVEQFGELRLDSVVPSTGKTECQRAQRRASCSVDQREHLIDAALLPLDMREGGILLSQTH